MNTRPVRIGIIGCGNVFGAYQPILEKLAARGWVQVVAICGRESQRATAGLAFPPARFTTDAAEVTRSGEVDLVVILTSMQSHAVLTRAALEAGKHVLVEKPMAASLEEAAALLSLSRQSPGYFVCAPFTVLSPTFQTIAGRLDRGEIGKVSAGRARYGWAGPDWTEWFYRPGGGCLFDLGVYSFTTLTGLLGPAKRVMAMTGVAIPQRQINGRNIRVEAEDNAQVLLDFGEASYATVMTGFTLQQYRSPALELYGTTGTIQMLGDDWDPDGYELWQNSAGAWQIFKETAPDWPWTDGLRHLVECIRSGGPLLVTPEHAYHVLEIMVKAKLSGQTGRVFDLESRFNLPRMAQPAAGVAPHLVHDRTREHSEATL